MCFQLPVLIAGPFSRFSALASYRNLHDGAYDKLSLDAAPGLDYAYYTVVRGYGDIAGGQLAAVL